MKPTFIRTTIYIEKDLYDLATYQLSKVMGKRRFSWLVNELLRDLVLADDELTNPVSKQMESLMQKRKKDMAAQQKLFHDTQEAQKQAESYKAARTKAIREATSTVLSRIADFDRYLPENDFHGDLCDEFFRVVDRISEIAGYDTEPSEIVSIYKNTLQKINQAEL